MAWPCLVRYSAMEPALECHRRILSEHAMGLSRETAMERFMTRVAALSWHLIAAPLQRNGSAVAVSISQFSRNCHRAVGFRNVNEIIRVS